MSKKIILALMLLLSITALAACGKENENANEKEEPKKTEKNVDLSDAFKKYKEVLENNRSAVGEYKWEEVFIDGSAKKHIAFYDITGDGIPEMFMMKHGKEPQADLHIYTYLDGKVKEMPYSFQNYMNFNNGNVENEGPLYNVAAGGGMNFAIYTTKDEKQLVLYSSQNNEYKSTFVEKYVATSENKLESKYRIANNYSDIDPDAKDITYENGQPISEEASQKAMNDLFSDMGKMIMFGKMADEGNSIWKNFSSKDSLAKTYAGAMKYLEEQIKK